MTSKDVLHSFFVPAFRIKQDVVPGLYTTLRFRPSKVGTYDIFCAEYCGTSHSMMVGKVHVLEPSDFRKWEQGLYKVAKVEGSSPKAQPLTAFQRGEKLYKTKTCNACHSIDGSRRVGPTLKGILGRTTKLNNGKTIKADENYIRRSLMDPMKEIVAGYPATMPTFRGNVTEEEMNDLIIYLKNLK